MKNLEVLDVYIVDDELAIREGLTNSVDWARYDAQVVGVGNNGYQAFQEVISLQPHILITDVKMPLMDGTELANKLIQYLPQLEIIFLSGYDNVEFLKEAIKVEAIDYLLKPFTTEEFYNALNKAITKIRTRIADILETAHLQKLLDEALPFLRDRCILDLVEKEQTDTHQLQDQLTALGIKLAIDRPFCVLILSVDNRQYVYRSLSVREGQLLDLKITEMAKQIILQENGYVLQSNLGELIIVLGINDENEEELMVITSKLRNQIAEILDFPFTIGIGNIVPTLLLITSSYRTAREAVDFKLYLGKNQNIAFNSILFCDTKNVSLDIFDTENIKTSLTSGNEEKAVQYISSILETFEAEQIDKRLHKMIINQISLDIIRHYGQLNTGNSLNQILEIVDKLPSIETNKEIIQILKQAVSLVCAATHDARQKGPARIIEKAIHIINQQYKQELTISTIATEVCLSPNYLCLLFKEETGQTINDFLTEKRIEEAKKLLTNPTVKVYEVSFEVGFSDTSYFTKLFKRYVGVTPSLYRREIGVIDD